MTDANRVRMAVVKEATLGSTPASPRMRTTRDTGEGLTWSPSFFTSNERRSDRMRADPSKILEQAGGSVNFEQSYPAALGAASAFIESAMFASWTETNSRDNDGTADSVITDIGTVANTAAFTTGTAFVIGQLVQTSGFTAAANNTVVRVTTGGATSLVATGSGWTAEAAPPATARIKVVGCEGVAADIVATSTGLTCTTLSFTAVGIIAGMWIKIGGAAVGQQFATTANNGWARVVSVTATAITLDNRPTGWSADVGTGKTIRLFFGDVIRNGTTMIGLTIERGFLGQTTPTYIVHRGMVVDQFSTEFVTEQGITGAIQLMGMTVAQGTSAISGATYAAAPTQTVMTSNANVGDVRVGAASQGSPNWVRRLTMQLANNLRPKSAVGSTGLVDIGAGTSDVTGQLECYFGSNALYALAIAGTPTSLSSRAGINGQWMVQTIPRATLTSAQANASGINTDVTQVFDYTASVDSTTSCSVQFDRLEYVE